MKILDDIYSIHSLIILIDIGKWMLLIPFSVNQRRAMPYVLTASAAMSGIF